MADDTPLPAHVVVNILAFALIFNLLVMAAGFTIVAGVASLLDQPALAAVFSPAAGFLVLLAGAFGVFRSALVELLEALVNGG